MSESTNNAAPPALPPVEWPSAHGFADTLSRLIAALTAAHMKIFARIDHAAEAAAVGLQMPPTTVLIYGNPRGGTPLMLAFPPVALDLPLRVLVREDAAGRTLVSHHPAAAMKAMGFGEEQLAGFFKLEALIARTVQGG